MRNNKYIDWHLNVLEIENSYFNTIWEYSQGGGDTLGVNLYFALVTYIFEPNVQIALIIFIFAHILKLLDTPF